MAFRDLVEGDCGGRNPMLKVASHFTKDQGFRDDLVLPHRQTDSRPEDVVSLLFKAHLGTVVLMLIFLVDG